MRELKFRYWDGERFQYYGWQEEFGRHYFSGIPVGLGVSLDDIFKGTEQYTSLKGRSGEAVDRALVNRRDSVPCDVEIYEGDIVDCHVSPYEPGCKGMDIRGAVVSYQEASLVIGQYSEWFCLDYIVRGNIHKNPELVSNRASD